MTIDSAAVAGALARLRERRPRVHCITNSAAVNFTANVLLSAGAIPSMTVNPEELPDFVASADALLVNLGTLDPLRREAIDVAVGVAGAAGTPWALDPVFVERSRPRLALARQLLARGPTVIRGNRPELDGLTGAGGDDAAADALARSSRATVVRTGEVDYVTDGARAVRIAGGHPLMASITAAGCAATALLAGFLAVEDDPVTAASACLGFVAAAAERAGAQAAGPGSFVPAFLDALHALTPEEAGAQARIS
ncbi:hydroxyethylthiazole kinase [Microbaculum marinum]|uniref:Hydroxyethylthiazole kinase n=1 Tax=Microbaculum marinum TaxID=1764581 RepID=A0AAW9RWK3_9HYPH